MPTIDQLGEWVKAEQRKGNGQCHTNHPVIMEHVRKEAIKNESAKTRIAFETYSPRSYSDWNDLLEWMMESLGCNPILVVDVMYLIMKLAGEEGVEMAKDNLFKLHDYEAELREARAKKKAKRKVI